MNRQLREYTDSSRALRTWFIAYGVGFPAILITNPHVFAKVSGSWWFLVIGIPFLLGVFIQIVGALSYKAFAHDGIVGMTSPHGVEPEWSWTARLYNWFGHPYADWVTLACFLAATVLAGYAARG